MYLHKDYEEMIDYNFEKNEYTIKKYNKDILGKSQGMAQILNGRFAAWLFYDRILYLVTDKIQIPFKDVQLELLSKDINEIILNRQLIIKNDSKVIDTIIYDINKKIIEEQVKYTEMAEVEDWDFGLNLLNIYKDRNRQITMFDIHYGNSIS